MLQTFVLGAASLARENVLLVTFGGREEVTAAGAEHQRSDRTHCVGGPAVGMQDVVAGRKRAMRRYSEYD